MTTTEDSKLHPDLVKVRDEIVAMLETDDEIATVSVGGFNGRQVEATPVKGDDDCKFRFEIGEANSGGFMRYRPERPDQIVMTAFGCFTSRYESKTRTFKQRKDGKFNWALIGDRVDEHLTDFVTASARREVLEKEAQQTKRLRDANQAALLERGILKEQDGYVSSYFTLTTDEGETIQGQLRQDGNIDLKVTGLELPEALRLLDGMGAS